MTAAGYLKIGFTLMMAVLLAASYAYMRPDVGLITALEHGSWSVGVMRLVPTAAIYCALFAPAVFLGTRRALGVSVILVGLVAFGPRLYAEYTILQQRAMAQEEDQTARALEDDPRLIDTFGRACQTVCKTLLYTGRIDAVRTANQYDIVEAFIWDKTSTRFPVYHVEDTFAPGDLTITFELLDPYALRHEWGIVDKGFATVEAASRLSITKGGFGDRANAPVLFRQTGLSHGVPVMPTVFQPVLSGWTSGGNRGGLELVRIKRWDTVTHDEAALAALAAIGLDLTPDPDRPD